MDNLFNSIPAKIPAEIFEVIIEADNFRLERIISQGHATPTVEWYDQETHEWVVLLSGKACLRFENGPEKILLPGDHVLINAHRRHRVEWTDPTQPTVWLALHYHNKCHTNNEKK